MHSGAKIWKKLTNSKVYNISKIEKKFLKKESKEVIKEINTKFNIIDMGCGDGGTVSIFLRQVSKRFTPKYCALDISKEMLAKSNVFLEKKFPKLNSEFHQLDFEEGNFAYLTENLKEKNYKTNLILLLTNTLDNVVDRSRVLTNIRESMTLNDYLLIGIELFDIKRTQNILKQYTKGSIVRRLVLNALKNYGVNEKDGEWVVDFNTNKIQIEIRFIPKKDLPIKIGRRKIILKKKNKSLLLAVSYKPTPKSLQLLLANSDFFIKKSFLVPNENYAFVLCKPTQW